MARVRIVATIGPASANKGTLKRMIESGMNIARLNFSHGSLREHKEKIRLIREAASEVGRPVAILADLQGPRIRIGDLPQPMTLKEGEEVILAPKEKGLGEGRLPTDYEKLASDLSPGDPILVDDGEIELTVLESIGDEVRCRVKVGGEVSSHKGINLPGVEVSAPALTDKDKADLKFALAEGVDYIAISFVKRKEDILEAKRLIEEEGADVPVIAKIERAQAIGRLTEILEVADGVMVARGDLGVELPLEEVPPLQKRMINEANRRGILVITATQMLESMTDSPRPTRAEVSDVANAVFDGTDAVMLSGETAAGRYPIRAVDMMREIIEEAEKHGEFFVGPSFNAHLLPDRFLLSDSLCAAASSAASILKAKAVVVMTQSGLTARLVSKYRPEVPIVAFTPNERIYRRMSLYWGVSPRMIEEIREVAPLIKRMEERLMAEDRFSEGDTVVIILGFPVASRPPANLLKLHRIGESKDYPKGR
ncbi:MAG: pyruvate kinase [Acidobacteria bacterium]|nr:pyruvate kinase [Acidobacteriota bacterium]